MSTMAAGKKATFFGERAKMIWSVLCWPFLPVLLELVSSSLLR